MQYLDKKIQFLKTEFKLSPKFITEFKPTSAGMTIAEKYNELIEKYNAYKEAAHQTIEKDTLLDCQSDDLAYDFFNALSYPAAAILNRNAETTTLIAEFSKLHRLFLAIKHQHHTNINPHADENSYFERYKILVKNIEFELNKKHSHDALIKQQHSPHRSHHNTITPTNKDTDMKTMSTLPHEKSGDPEIKQVYQQLFKHLGKIEPDDKKQIENINNLTPDEKYKLQVFIIELVKSSTTDNLTIATNCLKELSSSIRQNLHLYIPATHNAFLQKAMITSSDFRNARKYGKNPIPLQTPIVKKHTAKSPNLFQTSKEVGLSKAMAPENPLPMLGF